MSDIINRPSHYTHGEVEPIDAIESWQLGFHLGNVVKYIARAAHKGSMLEDLRKARWYLDRHIERLAKAELDKVTPIKTAKRQPSVTHPQFLDSGEYLGDNSNG